VNRTRTIDWYPAGRSTWNDAAIRERNAEIARDVIVFLLVVVLATAALLIALVVVHREAHPQAPVAPAGTRGDGNLTGSASVLIVSPRAVGTFDPLVVTVQSLVYAFNRTSNATEVVPFPDEVSLEISMDRIGPIVHQDLGTVSSTTAVALNTTLDWEWGDGRVRAHFARANVTLWGTFTLYYSDLARYILDANRERDRQTAAHAEREGFLAFWGNVFAFLFLVVFVVAFVVIGYSAHRYHSERGEDSWWDAVVRWTNASLERNPMKRILDDVGYEDRPRKEVLALLKQQELIEELHDRDDYDLPKLRALDAKIDHAILGLDRVYKRGRRVLVIARRQIRLREKEEKLIDRGFRVKKLAGELGALRESVKRDLEELDKEV